MHLPFIVLVTTRTLLFVFGGIDKLAAHIAVGAGLAPLVPLLLNSGQPTFIQIDYV